MNQRVLIVDDEPNVAMVLAESLEGSYEVATAATPQHALALLRQSHYALLITDYKMPGMNGLDLAREARRVSPQTQIVLMTAFGTEGLKDAAGKLNLEGYISKPFSLKQIRDIVEQAIVQTSQAQAPKSAPANDNRAYQELQRLQADTGARCIILLSASGYPIQTSGQTGGLDVTSVSALVAANFLASSELARLLGRDSIFKSSYHEGQDGADDNIYAYAINEEYLLAVVFGSESKPGAVWFYTKQSAGALAQHYAQQPSHTLAEVLSEGDLSGKIGAPGQLSQKFADEMDALWGGN